MGIYLELIPEWKSSALLGSALIDCTPTIDEVKKTAEMLAVYNALLQCKPTLNLPDVMLGKWSRIHLPCACHFLQFFHTDPNITCKTPAAFTITCFAYIFIKSIGKAVLIIH